MERYQTEPLMKCKHVNALFVIPSLSFSDTHVGIDHPRIQVLISSVLTFTWTTSLFIIVFDAKPSCFFAKLV